MLLETAVKLLKKTKRFDAPSIVRNVDPDFIPYVCHYNPNTILTKNGELLQIIRITGFKNESVSSELISLREAVRDAVKDSVKDNKFAFWFNTIRRKKNITPKGEFTDFFAREVNDFWVKDNNLQDQYVNELYITIIIEGLDSSVVNFNSFLRSFSYTTNKKLHDNFLSESHQKLKELVDAILNHTTEYGAKLLGLKEWDGVVYSEPMRFFGKIINLYEERYPLLNSDISDDLSTHKIAFGNRELEVIGYNNKNFASMMSLKEYREVSVDALDRILQLPFEFVITQSFDFTFDRKDFESYEYQNYVLRVSGDEEFRHALGIADFVENVSSSITGYGKLQTSIMLISKNKKDLESDIKNAIEQFSSLGFVVIREDVFSEHCFWSQLPANFSYLRRQKIINTNLIAGFSSLHNFPSGLISGGYWKNAVTVFKTVLNTPYFFNFHDHESGHTLVFGEANYSHTILLNFLISQSQKFGVRLFLFDDNKSSKVFINALSGDYFHYADARDEKFLKLNPLALANNIAHKDFLISFFASLTLLAQSPIPESELQAIPQVVDKILGSSTVDFAASIKAFSNEQTPNIAQVLQGWLNEELNFIFNSGKDLEFSNKINAFDLSDFFDQPQLLLPIVNYLFYKVELLLDGSPTIIVINDAWELLDNQFISPRIKSFLDKAKQQNAVVIFTGKNQEKLFASNLIKEIKDEFVNRIFTANANPAPGYKEILQLSEDDLEIIKMMEVDGGNFLLKRPDETVIISASFPTEIAKSFYSDEVAILAMEEVRNANIKEGQIKAETKDWIPQFFEIIKELEKEAVEEEKRLSREAAAEARRKKKEMDL